MAEAAVNPADTPAETEPAVEAAERTSTPTPKGGRRGTLLDAYA